MVKKIDGSNVKQFWVALPSSFGILCCPGLLQCPPSATVMRVRAHSGIVQFRIFAFPYQLDILQSLRYFNALSVKESLMRIYCSYHSTLPVNESHFILALMCEFAIAMSLMLLFSNSNKL
jgi:hypothetical protein